jgi:hypothetical protein
MADTTKPNDNTDNKEPKTTCTPTYCFGMLPLSQDGTPGKPLFFRTQTEARTYGAATHQHFAIVRRNR